MSYKILLIILYSINSFIWPAVPFVFIWSFRKYLKADDKQKEWKFLAISGISLLLMLELIIVGASMVNIWE